MKERGREYSRPGKRMTVTIRQTLLIYIGELYRRVSTSSGEQSLLILILSILLVREDIVAARGI
jgi:hypothetical protein